MCPRFPPSGFTRTNAIAEDLLQGFSVGGVSIIKWRERDSTGFYVVCGRSANACHQFLVFGKDSAPDIYRGPLIKALIRRGSASSDGFFQASICFCNSAQSESSRSSSR